jgi:hypothetical protein
MAKAWIVNGKYCLGMRVDLGDSRKELLIFGGSPSIAKPIIERAIVEGNKRTANRKNPTDILIRVM